MTEECSLAVQSELLEIAAQGIGLKGIATRLAELIEKQIVITNPTFRVLASSANAPFREKEFLAFAVEKPETGTGILQGAAGKVGALMVSIKSAAETLGFLFILHPGDSPSELADLGKRASLVLGLVLDKQHELTRLVHSQRENFIFDLLYGNIESNEEIITRGEILGWNMNRPHGVIVFEIDQYEHFSEDRRLAELLHDIVKDVLHDLKEQGITMQKKGEVVVILPMTRESRRAQRAFIKFLINKVNAQLREKMGERVVRVGVGRHYESPNEIFRSYQEAKVALELGSLMHSQVRTPFFVELGLARIIYNHDKQELIEFYRETLGDLERYDQSQKGDLMETLEKFLIHNGNLKETADAIFLHPNTLRYRLKKIEEILEVNLDDLDTMLNLKTAFQIKYLKQL